MATSITGQGITAYKAPDNALSNSSKNAVQNKIVYEEINELQTQLNQLRQNALSYVLEPSASAIIYNPDAPNGQKIFPTTLSVNAYRINSDGSRSGYTADIFWYTCIDSEGIPVAGETRYNMTGISITLPQTITNEAIVEFYIQKNPEGEIGLPNTLAKITIPILKTGPKGDSGENMSVVTLTGTNITKIAADNTVYKCGELTELTFTAPASGITAIRFSSGSTPTVASFPGVTWLGDFDPDNLLANVIYEINIFDGVGVAGWA